MTRGQKAAKTLTAKNPAHFSEIGSDGGKKAPGTFQTLPGFAVRAGQRSGKVRKIKAIAKKVAELKHALDELPELADGTDIKAAIEQCEQEMASIGRELGTS